MKKCKIINGPFSWFLKVDGEIVPFSGSSAAQYFLRHYLDLNYQVDMIDESKSNNYNP